MDAGVGARGHPRSSAEDRLVSAISQPDLWGSVKTNGMRILWETFYGPEHGMAAWECAIREITSWNIVLQISGRYN